MAAIAGIIRFDGAPAELAQLQRMTATMQACGADGIAHWHEAGAALGQCRLATTPGAGATPLPLPSDDGKLVMVFDGWLSNWEELGRALELAQCDPGNGSDAELVLRAYQRWGEDCLQRIEGDFALVIWDRRRQQAFCARDRMGHKLLHYYWNGRVLVFASDLAAVLAVDEVPELPNTGMLAEYLSSEFYTRDETLWRDVWRLVAAHRMQVSRHGLARDRYWEPEMHRPLCYQDDRDYVAHYRELFLDLVRRHSRSQAPLAVEVSGGLDSTAVLAAAEHLRRNGRLLAPDLAAYTLQFEPGSDADELRYARAAAEFLHLELTPVPAARRSPQWYAQQIRERRDFPGFANAVSFEGLRSRAAQDGHRVLLGGEGGDFWLEGRHAYLAEEFLGLRWGVLASLLRQDCAEYGAAYVAAAFLREAVLWQLPRPVQQVLRRIKGTLTQRGANASPAWLSPALRAQLATQKAREGDYDISPGPVPGQRLLVRNLTYAFNAQFIERNGRRCAALGLELRHPMNHHRFAEFALSVPARIRARGEQVKWVHARALHGMLPPAILARRDKGDFSFLMAAHAAEQADRLRRQVLRRRKDWVDAAATERLLDECAPGHAPTEAMWALSGLLNCDTLFAQFTADLPGTRPS